MKNHVYLKHKHDLKKQNTVSASEENNSDCDIDDYGPRW